MRLGCCVNVGTFVPGAKESDESSRQVEKVARKLWIVKEAGFDFVELTVGLAMNPPGGDLALLEGVLEEVGLTPMAFNSFVPQNVRLTGPNVDNGQVKAFLEESVSRIARLGGKVIVFGSGNARQFPEGWSPQEGREQLTWFLDQAADVAGEHGVTIAIEPLNKGEDNALNLVSEGLEMAERVARPEVSVLADLYHMMLEDEPFDVVRTYANALSHVHVADTGRKAPGSGDWDYPGFFGALIAGGYDGAISIECNWDDFPGEAASAHQTLRKAWHIAQDG